MKDSTTDSKPKDNNLNTITDILNRECDLFSSLPQNIFKGVSKRISQFQENPASFSSELAVAAALGASIIYLKRNPQVLAKGIAKVLPACKNPEAIAAGIKTLAPQIGKVLLISDISTRLGLPALDTAINAKNLENNKIKLGNNVGAAVIDYSLMGIAGTSGALATDVAPSAINGLRASNKILSNIALPKFPNPKMRLAFADGNIEDLGIATEAQMNISLKEKPINALFMKKTANLGNGKTVELYDDATGAILSDTGMRESIKHKPIDQTMHIIYKPFENIMEMLQSVKLITSDFTQHSSLMNSRGSMQPFYWLTEFISSPNAKHLVGKLSGKWEPEFSTHKSLELKNDAGRVVSLNSFGTREACPILIHPLKVDRVGNYQLEHMPKFRRLVDTNRHDSLTTNERYNLERQFDSSMKNSGWHYRDMSPLNFAELPTGWKVALNAYPKAISESECRNWTESDHARAAKIYKAAYHNLKDLYGQNHPLFVRLKANMATHAVGSGDFSLGEKVFKDLVKVDYVKGLMDLSQALFYNYRSIGYKYTTELSRSRMNDQFMGEQYMNKMINYGKKMEHYSQRYYNEGKHLEQ